MPDQADVSRLARQLPDVVATDGQFGFAVLVRGKPKGFVWAWPERVDPKRPKVPNPGVLVARVVDLATKEELLAADPSVFFTEPHYDGYKAVLVRLAEIEESELAEVLADAWLCTAPPTLARQWEGRLGPGAGDGPLRKRASPPRP